MIPEDRRELLYTVGRFGSLTLDAAAYVCSAIVGIIWGLVALAIVFVPVWFILTKLAFIR